MRNNDVVMKMGPTIFVVAIILLSSCAYGMRVGNNAMGIATISIGHGAGTTIQAGPIHTGLGVYSDNLGVRDAIGIVDNEFMGNQQSMTAECIAIGADRLRTNSGKGGYVTSNVCFMFPVAEPDVATWKYYTKIDVSVSAGGGIRCGISIGHLLATLWAIVGGG